MVHRLNNWLFARDLMCSNPDMAFEVMRNILRDMGIFEVKDASLKEMISRAGCVISQDGFEASLNFWRKDVSPYFADENESPKFEIFLENFDNMLRDMIELHAKGHRYI